jgi:hypothetical protein
MIHSGSIFDYLKTYNDNIKCNFNSTLNNLCLLLNLHFLNHLSLFLKTLLIIMQVSITHSDTTLETDGIDRADHHAHNSSKNRSKL